MWDHELIEEGSKILETAMRRRAVGPSQLQAAIATLHSRADTFAGTDWPQIAALYGVLADVDPGPVVAFNRAVAIGFTDGAEAGLEHLDRIDPASLPQPHLRSAARGELLLRLDRRDEAVTAFDEAISRAIGETERRHLERRRRAATDI